MTTAETNDATRRSIVSTVFGGSTADGPVLNAPHPNLTGADYLELMQRVHDHGLQRGDTFIDVDHTGATMRDGASFEFVNSRLVVTVPV